MILQANSGLPFNLRSNLDLNQDGVNNDRPLDVERNAGRLGRVVYLDMRYSRFIPLPRCVEGGIVLRGEEPVQHREHRRRKSGRHGQARSGVPATALIFDGSDYPNAGKSGYDQRTMQLGLKFNF